MTQTYDNALDRYIGMTDSVIRDRKLLDDWMTVFAPDAIVDIGPNPVRGHSAIVEFYQQWATGFQETKHIWSVTELEDGTLRAEWAAAVRLADDSVQAVSGVEHAKVDAEGRMTALHNEFTVPPSA